MRPHRSYGYIAVALFAFISGCSGTSQLSPSTIGSQTLQQTSKSTPETSLAASRYGGAFALSPSLLRTRGIRVPHVTLPNRKLAQWGNVLFVADYSGNVVQQFEPKKNGAVVATISDVVGPQGMDSDSQGNLYVTSQGTSSVNEYAPGSYTASKILNEGNQQAPASVAVCGDGTVYVSNTYANGGNSNGSIQIFAPGATSPTGSIPDRNIFFSFFVACDRAGNVWYDYVDTNFGTHVAEYTPTFAGTIREFGSLGIAFPGGIRILGNGLISINDQSTSQFNGLVQIFNRANMTAGPVSTISGFLDPVSGSWTVSGQATWQADISNLQVDYATLTGTPQIKYAVGAGVLLGPVDALIFPVNKK